MTQQGMLDLGTFEGFNFRQGAAIDRLLTAQEVVGWEHDQHGEAEFWPSGDHAILSHLFPDRVTRYELQTLAALLSQMEGQAEANLLQICFACQAREIDLEDLTVERLDERFATVFEAATFYDARRAAAFELFETYWPDLYRAWESDSLGILRFEWEDFLDCGTWITQELRIKERCIFMVAPAC